MKEIIKWIKHIFYMNNLGDLQEDIELGKIDFNKYVITIPAGSEWYRFVHKGQDPLVPTGKETRFVSENPDYTFEKYKTAITLGNFITIGTGATYFSETISIASKETTDSKNKDLYKITLLSSIEITDMDSICRARRICKPYMRKEKHPIFHLFYSKHLKGLRYESAQDSDGYNFVIYNDWFPEFKNIVKRERVGR